MRQRHWSDEELIARLYGAGLEDGHLEECAECARRWKSLLAARERFLAEPDLHPSFWEAQRARLHARLERSAAPSRWRQALAPLAATAAMLFLAVLLWGPAPGPQPNVASTDRHVFQEVYSLLESEPAAVTPIYGLFEVEP
ncbi:MAG: hypothetical protein RMK57_10370 [Bryobacterales bacterium]|nr:hypothetical protein [Bryobacteraceae bacterium]MDW8354920.1 hypothetical protein [Bryobacterales bacterium]